LDHLAHGPPSRVSYTTIILFLLPTHGLPYQQGEETDDLIPPTGSSLDDTVCASSLSLADACRTGGKSYLWSTYAFPGQACWGRGHWVLE